MPHHWAYLERDQTLSCGDREVRLTPKAAAVLACLLRRKGQLVSHAELLGEVWGGLSVSPDLVREYVFDLRSALEDDARRPRYIETVRGRGVRLIGGIDLARAPEFRRRAALRVEPARSLGGGPVAHEETGVLAEGLLHCLSGMTDVIVIGEDAGDAVADGADYALRTSLSTTAGRVVASFRMVDVATGANIWARRFDAAHGTPSPHWDHVAAVVANEIASWRGVITRAEVAKARKIPPASRDAHHHYMLALAFERQRDHAGTDAARRHIERSLDLDPENPRGWLLLWHMLERPFILLGEPLAEETLALCERALVQAHTQDPDDPLILANVCGERARAGDLGGAVTALERAAEIGRMQADTMSPCANAYATIAGDADAARAHLARAHALNPTLKDWLRFATARIAFFSRDFAACRAAAGRNPDLLPLAIFRILSLAMEGRKSEARAARRAMQRRFPRAEFDDYAARLPISAPAARGLYEDAVRRL